MISPGADKSSFSILSRLVNFVFAGKGMVSKSKDSKMTSSTKPKDPKMSLSSMGSMVNAANKGSKVQQRLMESIPACKRTV